MRLETINIILEPTGLVAWHDVLARHPLSIIPTMDLEHIPTPLTGKDADSVDEVHLPATIASVLTDHDLVRHPLGTVVPHDALASLTERAHASLTGIGAGDHHTPHYPTLADHPLSIIPNMDDAHIPTAFLLDASRKITGNPRIEKANPYLYMSETNVSPADRTCNILMEFADLDDTRFFCDLDWYFMVKGEAVGDFWGVSRTSPYNIHFMRTCLMDTINERTADAGVTIDGVLLKDGLCHGVLKGIQKYGGIFWFNVNWLPSGMITSGQSGSGALDWYDFMVSLYTSTTSASSARVEKKVDAVSPLPVPMPYTWDKQRHFCAKVRIASPAMSAQYIHLVSGYLDYASSINTNRHIGFKVVDNVLYGTVGNATAESTLVIETLTGIVGRTLEVVFTPAVEARFYVNGVDRGAITTNLPSGAMSAQYLFCASVYNTAAANKRIDIAEVRVLQEE